MISSPPHLRSSYSADQHIIDLETRTAKDADDIAAMIKKIAFLEAEVKHLSAQTKKQSDDYALLLSKFNELTQAKAAIDQRGMYIAVY